MSNTIKACRHGPMIFNTLDQWIGRSLDIYGEFSNAEVDFLVSMIGTDNVVLDVGANIGALTIPLARHLSQGYVIAIEPQESVYHALCGNIAINNLRNVKALHRAVSNIQDQIIWVPNVDYSREGNFGGVSLAEQANICSGEADVAAGKCYPVLSVKIDQLQLPRCDLIKIDVEGMELEVLQGAVETIEKYKPLLYVECDREDTNALTIDFIESLGYSWKQHIPPLFNEDNFNQVKNNLLTREVTNKDTGKKEMKTVISSNIFCWHSAIDMDMSDYEHFVEI